MSKATRIVSFSFKPSDTKAKIEIDYLKAYCAKKGLNFSSQVLKAIKNHNEELRNNDN